MSSEMRELAEEGLAYFERIGDAGDKKYVAAIRALIARTEAGADGVSIWRYRFRNSETGGWHEWRYSEQEPVLNSFVADKTEIQGPFTHPQDASGDAERTKYEELIYAVGNKYPGETRHETALRYIRQAESHVGSEGCVAMQAKEAK